MRFLNRIDWKYVWIILGLSFASALTYKFSGEIITAIKTFFEIRDLNIIAGGIAAIITITHKIKKRRLKFSPSMSFTAFRIPIEDLMSFVGNPITLVCSISLAKGVFYQAWGDETWGSVYYFPHFKGWEVTFIGIVTAYLFFISLMDLLRHVKETLLRNAVVEEHVTPISDSDVIGEIPKPLN
ncbi:MAG: hypothetical protein WDO14_09120 [Bacteroidota bacterium]